MKTPAWYYQEAAHRYRAADKDAQRNGFARKCSWCGTVTRNKNPEQDRARAGRVVRVCLDRQAMLFVEADFRGPAIGWSSRSNWNNRYRK
jgi:hypothetical protein